MQTAARQLREEKRSERQARATAESDGMPSGRLRGDLPSSLQKLRPQGRAAVGATKMARAVQPPLKVAEGGGRALETRGHHVCVVLRIAIINCIKEQCFVGRMQTQPSSFTDGVLGNVASVLGL